MFIINVILAQLKHEKNGIFLEYNCPYGDAISNNGEVTLCQKAPNKPYDSCPSGSYCYEALGTVTDKNFLVGHCCPEKPKTFVGVGKTVCPVGNPHLSARCVRRDFSIPYELLSEEQLLPYCPLATHRCIGLMCCPLPCSRPTNGWFSVNNSCYHLVALGYHCNSDAQCQENAECKETSEPSTVAIYKR